MLNTEYQNSSASIAWFELQPKEESKWTYNTLFHVVCVSVKCIKLSHTGQLYSPWHITAVIITTQGLHSPQKQNLVVWTQSVNTVCSLGCQSAACKFLGVDVKLVSVDLRQYWVLEHNMHKVKKAVMTLYQVHWNTTHTRWEWLMTQYQVHWNTIHTRWERLLWHCIRYTGIQHTQGENDSWHSIRYTETQYTQGDNGCHDTVSGTPEHNTHKVTMAVMTQYQVHRNTIHTRWEWLSWHSIRYPGTQYTQGENGCHDTLSCTLEHNNRRWEWLSLHSIKIKHK